MFPCIGCGACCRTLGDVGDLSVFGLEADENGHCTKLVNNSCSIYEARPDICRIDKMNIGMDIEVYYNVTARICLELMLKEKLETQ